MMRPEHDRELTDESLLRRALDDPGPDGKDAIAKLLLRYRGHLYQWCFRYLHDHDEALDLSQEVVLEVFRSLKNYRGQASFSTWLFAVTRNRCVDALRKRSRVEVADTDLDLLEDPRSDTGGEFERREETERMLRLIRENLSTKEQEAVCLQVFEAMPIETITRVLGITGTSGARSILQSARRKLRAAATKRAEAEGDL